MPFGNMRNKYMNNAVGPKFDNQTQEINMYRCMIATELLCANIFHDSCIVLKADNPTIMSNNVKHDDMGDKNNHDNNDNNNKSKINVHLSNMKLKLWNWDHELKIKGSVVLIQPL